MKRAILIYFFIVMAILCVGCKSVIVFGEQPNKTVESKTNNVTDYKVNIKEYIAYNEKNKPFKCSMHRYPVLVMKAYKVI